MKIISFPRSSKIFFLSALFILPFLGVGIWMISFVNGAARPVILSPRLGAPLFGPSSPGLGENVTDYMTESITVWISPDPMESSIPQGWWNLENWDVALLPAIMPTANCTPLRIIKLSLGNPPNTFFGGSLDTNLLVPSALGIECQIPADISPLLYHLIIGYRQDISPSRQQSGQIDIIPQIGSWQGDLGGIRNPFLLSEPSCVFIPWINDATASNGVDSVTSEGLRINPFTLMHVTDLHYKYGDLDQLKENILWSQDAMILSPDILVLTGDVVTHPATDVRDYETAYGHLSKIGIPMVIGIGNHDQYNEGPWHHYFGPVFSVTQINTVSIISFDAVIPLSTSTINWVDRQAWIARSKDPISPIFYASHYPPLVDYFSGGWLGILDSMKVHKVTAYLGGHYHIDLAGEINNVLTQVAEHKSVEHLDEVLDLPGGSQEQLLPITSPMLLLTRSAGEKGHVIFQERFAAYNYAIYPGYRKISIVNNQVWNYTYDLDGDGQREGQVSTPSGRYHIGYSEDIGLGSSPSAGIYWHLSNNGTDFIPAARAIFTVPHPPAGMDWDLTLQNKTAGAYIRTQISNNTHFWIDARVPVSPLTDISLRLEPKLRSV